MPFYLEEVDILPQVAGLRSVLIVPCRFCPAASLAVSKNEPYIEPFRRLLRTQAYEEFIRDLAGRLEDAGIATARFDSKLVHQFTACMWSSKRRKELAQRASEFDAVLVLGCDAMVESVAAALDSTDCRVIQGMEIEGLMNVLPRVSFPLNISLELEGVTPMTCQRSAPDAGGAHP